MDSTAITPERIIPTKELCSKYDGCRGREYFVDYYDEKMSKVGNGMPVHSYHHLAICNDLWSAINFQASHLVYNYIINVGDSVRYTTNEDEEFILLVCEDGLYYSALTDEVCSEVGRGFDSYMDRLAVDATPL